MLAAVGRFASLALLVALAHSSEAQPQTDVAERFLAEKYIHEITVDAPNGVKVFFSRARADGKMGPDEYILCERMSSGAEYMAMRDLDLKTDDRWVVKPGTCDALLVAARRRKQAQGR